MPLLECSQTRLFDLELCIICVSCAYVNMHPSVQQLTIKGEGLSAIKSPNLITRKPVVSLRVV